jgi:hypothetical protein
LEYLNLLFVLALKISQANPDMDSTANSVFGVTLGNIKPENQYTGYTDKK